MDLTRSYPPLCTRLSSAVAKLTLKHLVRGIPSTNQPIQQQSERIQIHYPTVRWLFATSFENSPPSSYPDTKLSVDPKKLPGTAITLFFSMNGMYSTASWTMASLAWDVALSMTIGLTHINIPADGLVYSSLRVYLGSLSPNSSRPFSMAETRRSSLCL